MSTYRQVRRQARRARRGGLQPIVVIGTQFPTPAGVVLARLAGRYRPEIAPAARAGAILAAGWWLRRGHADLWAWLSDVPDPAACALVLFGARFGLSTLAEAETAAETTTISDQRPATSDQR